MMRHLRARPYLLFLLPCILLGGLLSIAQAQSLPLYQLPPATTLPRSSSSLLLTASNRLLVTNAYSDSLAIINISTAQIEAEILVGAEPRSVALTPDGRFAVTANRLGGSLSVIDVAAQRLVATYPLGALPQAVLATNAHAFVSMGGDSSVIQIEIETGRIVNRIPTAPDPAGMALWGDFLYVTHFWTGELSLIYLPTAEVVRSIRVSSEAALSASIEIDPRAGLAYLPQSLSRADADSLSYDNRIVPVLEVVDLARMQVLSDRRILLTLADRAVNMPQAVKIDTVRNRVYVLYAGSNGVSVLSSQTGLATAHFDTGANPRSLQLSRDGLTVFVHNAVDQSVSSVDGQFFSPRDTIPSSERAVPAQTLIGARLFHSARDARLSANPSISCASCHEGGGSDGRRWGGRLTPPLGQAFSPDQLNQHIASLQAGAGLPASSVDMAALVAYLASLGQVHSE